MNIAFIMNDRRSVLSSVPPDFLKSMLISPVAALRVPKLQLLHTALYLNGLQLIFSWDSFSDTVYTSAPMFKTVRIHAFFYFK